MKISLSLKSKVKNLLDRSRRALQRRKRPVMTIPVYAEGPPDQYARIPVIVKKNKGR